MLPFGHKQELGKGRTGLFLLPPPPLAIAAAWVGGSVGDPSRGPSLGQQRKAQRSHPNQGLPGAGAWPRSRAAAGLSWALGRLRARVPPKSPLPHQERCPGAEGAQPGRWAASPGTDGASFLLVTFLFSLGMSQVGDIQESRRDEFPWEEALSPSPPAGLASRPAPHSEGHPRARLAKCSRVQTCHPCSWVLVVQT